MTVRSSGDDNNELPYCKMINRLLPKEIRIVAWSPVAEDFSARFDCRSRTYKYWFPRGELDVDVCIFIYFYFNAKRVIYV